MKYRAIRYFKDAKDDNRAYKVGDVYPRPGLEVSEERLEQLRTNKNRRGVPMIEIVEEEKPKPKKAAAKQEAPEELDVTKKTIEEPEAVTTEADQAPEEKAEAPKPKRRKKKNAD